MPSADFAAGGRALELALRRWVLPAPVLPRYFQDDPTMRSWARLAAEYRVAGAGYWHRARLAGDQQITWRRTGAPLEQGQLILALCADGEDFASGYRMTADFGAGGADAAIVSVFERERRAGGTVMRLGGAGLEKLSLAREAGRLVVRSGARVVLEAPDTLKLRGGRAGARALGGWRLRISELETVGASLLDEVFARAPVNWETLTGTWEVSSRWKCDPEFTWMLGRRRRGVARADLKRPLSGDFQVDAHFAVAMAERCAPFYDFTTNLTLSLSPDPRRPVEGYVFAFGGIDVPSRILRRGKVVAEGDGLIRPNARAGGGGGGIHSHWFHVRLIRKGSRLALIGDGEKLCDFTDPEPLAGAGHLSLWTRGDNGVTLARFRLEADRPLGPPRSPLGKPGGKTVREKLPAALSAFANRDGAAGAVLSAVKDEGGRLILRMENVNAGGSFAAAWAPPGGIDLDREGWLSFRWRSSPGARFNLYLLRGGRTYRAAITGPAGRDGGRYRLRALGRVPGAKPGSEWQEFSFDLRAALVSADPRVADLRVEEIRVGNYEFEDAALLEGLSANGAGEWIELADWTLSRTPPPANKLPPVKLLVDSPGTKSPPVRLDTGGRFDPRGCSLGTARRGAAFDGAALRYDAFNRRLTFTPRLAGIAFAPGENIVLFHPRGPSDKPEEPPVARLKIFHDPKLDKRPPSRPRLVSPAPLDFDDFEKSLGSWKAFGGLDGAELVLDGSTSAAGRRCLLAENRRCGGTIGAMARTSPFDVRRYPTLQFDYRVERFTHVNLLLYTSGGRQEMTLTDHRGGADNLGHITGARGDGRWHRAEIDLDRALRYRRRTIVRALGFADLGPGSSTTAGAWRVDNWTLLPVINGKRPVEFRWTADDESGISGYAAVIDRRSSTEPPRDVNAREARLRRADGLAEGHWYLHVRARDRAGNWGPAAHWFFKSVHRDDEKAPSVASVSPAADASACPRQISAVLSEEGGGISAHDVELTVGSRGFRPGDEGVTFYPSSRRLTVDLTGFGGQLRLPAGEQMCTLRAVDYAGNVMPPYRWKWKLDPSADKAEPPAPRVIYLPSDRLVFEDFESGQGVLANWRRGMVYRKRARSRGGAGMGRGFAAISGRRLHDNNNEVQLWPSAFDPEYHSHLAFDYRMARGTSFDFLVQVNNLHYTLSFGRFAAGWSRRLGRLATGKDDGEWHRAEIDLRKLPDAFPKGPDGKRAAIQKLLAVSRTQDGSDVDNFVLASPFGRDPEFIWSPPAAPSGVSGYSWALDGKADTVPPEKLSGTDRRAVFRGVKPGTYWFHVRALSGAGRWGRTAHLKFSIQPRP
jgi:hypothetical protein